MKKVVVIGNGMVGYKFCEKFVASEKFHNYKLTVFGEEPRRAYDRVHLSEYYAGKSAEDLSLSSTTWYEENNIDLHISEMITKINKKEKAVINHRGEKYSYDYLVLATGSSAFVPPIPGVEKEGVFVYRTIEDLEAIKYYAKKLKSEGKNQAAVLGGGLLGLEAANAVKELGLQAHVVEFAPRLMPRQLDQGGSDMLKAKIEELGLHIHLGKQTKNIEGDHVIEGLKYVDGSELKVDMLVVSAGIRPRDEIAKECKLATGIRGGIIVDNTMKTSDDHIYAIGEVALYNNMIYGLVAPGYDMADVAVSQITGNTKNIMKADIDMSTQLKLIGTEVASFGNALHEGENVDTIIYKNKRKGIYKRINISKESSKLLGGILVGNSSDYNTLFQIYNTAMTLPENPEDLILGNRNDDNSSLLGDVMDLPDDAQICSCESVSKNAICSAIQDGSCNDLGDVISCTKAGTGCGGCKPMVKDLVDATLKSLGRKVNDIICEHFEYNRQELFDIIKLKGYRKYNQILDNYGKGDGCEVCKPVIASIMASIYADTANEETTIQDSNDRFLANIQRNGTYSVVPRIPGGEITPEKLIALGKIGKKYDLYTKITGGQRVDFFGARLDQLPKIWEDLINYGFESGHAYGKSLRTVKSCVGSTWCRYGMDESVSFAIELEERYKGLRSPHKIKGGVSGCIRECAEARCKDFGVIAVEGGWNLYICGNGGANPKHAELLAEQIDNETVIRYLDRFLMFYIRTAAPLERTAKWLDKLEGGIEYLKQVIIHNKLDIVEELESEMKTLVGSFKCEWTQAIQDKEIMKRFNHFVNSDETDNNLVFVPLRDQKMPEPWK
ncbi:nitrite reductase (NADH) large subunit [Aquimarina sp. EL_43]|uniref:nitrite reductase large subunit NirB n=1 Tax=unclassified Aquimarina TaxID=2627091 RepID=UPI0018CAB0CC|nr:MULTISPECIES: nitrite reductase large subunit NirB [unclassified Aquimarina]MBG6132198.1 nitrite reductase (NADH) large subunit [Aquimarina sp. EL_35]MBG6152995.1 nitrite reductase (NADH) large subunit [Aquimarina sp. EL_32]MBG6171002.1 nitrite reductase (NADH) large subunit [Aquimarina sp. EL_43]